MNNTPTLTRSEEFNAPWNQPLEELYDWAREDCQQDPLDRDD